MTADLAQRPNRIPWPPLIYIAAVAAALAIEHVLPSAAGWQGFSREIARYAGWAGLAVGAGLDLSAMITMARANANILPHRAATRLVTWGPFRVSRNPIYLGNTVMTASAALAFGKLWLLLAAVVAALVTHRLAILREEVHLAANFGGEWQAYVSRTSRWLGWSHSQ